jgi:hypothetical protein
MQVLNPPLLLPTAIAVAAQIGGYRGARVSHLLPAGCETANEGQKSCRKLSLLNEREIPSVAPKASGNSESCLRRREQPRPAAASESRVSSLTAAQNEDAVVV